MQRAAAAYRHALEAEPASRAALEIDPSLPTALWLRPQIELAEGRPSEALEVAEAALEIAPDSALLLALAGRLALLEGRPTASRDYLHKALRDRPQEHLEGIYLARALELIGEPALARTLWRDLSNTAQQALSHGQELWDHPYVLAAAAASSTDDRDEYAVIPLAGKQAQLRRGFPCPRSNAIFRRELMRYSRALTAALVCALLAAPVLAGSVSGKIIYDDKVPKLRAIAMDADPACAEKHSSPVQSEALVLGDGNALANVFVQIKDAPAGNHSAPSEPLVIDQKGCIYQPHVAGAMVGQTVQFKNSDGILHNVHGLPKENREFNIGMPPTVKTSDKEFNKPEPLFKVKCDVHPWMNAYVAVMTHPYFSVTDKSGSFSIAGVPDGTYQVEAWHERLGTQTGSVTVSGGNATVDFSFKIPKRN